MNRYIAGGGNEGWYQYRIPLLGPDTIGGSSQSVQDVLRNVQYVRLWLSGFADSVEIRIAEMGLTGNQWQERIKNDTTFGISVVNIEDNPEYENSPGYQDLGIVREKDRTQPDKVIEGNEQSLTLVLNGLQPGDSRQAVRYFGTARPLNLFNYKTMKMFVYGDPALMDQGTGEPMTELFVRFGNDTLNYYEYRAPIQAFWDSANWVTINFEELTAVKAARDSANRPAYVDIASPPGARYGVLGNPSLRQVVEISVGVEHLAVPGRPAVPLYGEVWINELRLTDVDDTPGLAYRYDTQVKLADFGNLGFNYAQTDPTFHALADRFGNQATSINWAVNANLNLEDFVPKDWKGTTIPFSYSHREQLVKPKYLPNTDIVVEEAALLAADVHLDSGEVARETPDQIVTRSQILRDRRFLLDAEPQDRHPVQRVVRHGDPQQAHLRLQLQHGPRPGPGDRDQERLELERERQLRRDDRPERLRPAVQGGPRRFLPLQLAQGLEAPPEPDQQPDHGSQRAAGQDLRGDADVEHAPARHEDPQLVAERVVRVEAERGGPPEPERELQPRDRQEPQRVRQRRGREVGGGPHLHGPLPRERQEVRAGFQDEFEAARAGHLRRQEIPRPDAELRRQLQLAERLPEGGHRQERRRRQSHRCGHELPAEAVHATPGSPAPTDRNRPRPGGALPRTEGADRGGHGEEGLGGARAGRGGGHRRGFLRAAAEPRQDFHQDTVPRLRQRPAGFLPDEQVDQSRAWSATPGIGNFWGRLPFQAPVPEWGPGRLYQLGFLFDPLGDLKVGSQSSFPFIDVTTVRGRRASNAVLTNTFNQSNNIAIKTDRPLWPGAKISFDWKIGWQYSRTTRDTTDSFGIPATISTTTSGSIERSYLTFPSVLFFKVFNTNLESVGKKYDEYQTTMPQEAALSKAFEEGLEALPWLSKLFGKYYPRVNWSLRWDGVEKIAGITSVVERMSIDHAYTSSFRRDFREIVGVGEQTDVERTTYGFAPLLGLNATFKQFLKGSLTGNLKFNSLMSYDLHLSSTNRNITEDLTQDIQMTVSYARSGFSFPLFGVNLSNDINVSFTYTLSKKSQRLHVPSLLSTNQEGNPIGGSTRTQMEPRLRYVLSSRVTAALYYRLSKIEPDSKGSSVVGTTTNEAGLDIHISI